MRKWSFYINKTLESTKYVQKGKIGANYTLCSSGISRGRQLLPKSKRQKQRDQAELGLVIIDNNSSNNRVVVTIPSFRSRSMTPTSGTARGRYHRPASSSSVSAVNNSTAAAATVGGTSATSDATSVDGTEETGPGRYVKRGHLMRSAVWKKTRLIMGLDSGMLWYTHWTRIK